MIQGGVNRQLLVVLVNGEMYFCDLGSIPGRSVRTSAYEIQLLNCRRESGVPLGIQTFPKTAILRLGLAGSSGEEFSAPGEEEGK